MSGIIQGYWSKKKSGGGTTIYDDAIYIFSPRLLRSAYVGPCGRVKRDSDNAEQDINFVGGVIDEASIISFCGAANGYFNFYNQGTDSSNYPTSFNTRIYDGSAIDKINGFPALYFNGSITSWRPNVASTSDYLLDKPSMMFATGVSTRSNAISSLFGESLTNNLSLGLQIMTGTDTRDIDYRPDNVSRRIDFASNATVSQLYLFGYTKNNSGTINGYVDGVKEANELTGLSGVGFTTTGTSSLKWGGGRSATFAAWFLTGYSHELIAFDYYDATREADVQLDMMTYYGI